ncbi:class I adenylate-forming enzyme family protein [Haloarchaeobius sp. DYHT-AS-18]|uniref:class I adenylate-forming enzyme family protein n=1 Tax=Haloarchaeobius sp. DYHT-AS-18 TaxID=3446117 RepID=UPI003EB97E17
MTTALTIVDSLEQGATWYPDREALIQGEQGDRRSVTYREVDEVTRQFAIGLGSLGVEKGDRIAMLNRSTVEHTIAFLGALRAGAIPATLHFRESDAAIRAMVEKITPRALVFQPQLEATATHIRERCETVETYIALDQLGEPPAYATTFTAVTASNDSSATLPSIDRDDSAFINFSSGTTGTPKPVVHTHGNVVESGHLGMFKKGIRPTTRTLKTNTPSFIAWANATFPVLTAGASIVYLERSEPAEILTAISAEAVTSVVLVPTVWKRILAEDLDSYDLSSVELAGYAGEPLEPALFASIRDAITPNVCTMYGTTETMSSSMVLFPADVTNGTLDSIGYPVPNTEVRLVEPGTRDPANEVEPGETGEILIRGPSVAEEIWNDPVSTRETFHEDGWVFTGDLAHVGDETLLYLNGRQDNMIVSGGINVYPETVREAIASHPRIEDVALIGVSHREWGQTLKAIVVPSDETLTEGELETICRTLPALSEYQRPRQFEFVTELPRTGTNKIDYAALKACYGD